MKFAKVLILSLVCFFTASFVHAQTLNDISRRQCEPTQITQSLVKCNHPDSLTIENALINGRDLTRADLELLSSRGVKLQMKSGADLKVMPSSGSTEIYSIVRSLTNHMNNLVGLVNMTAYCDNFTKAHFQIQTYYDLTGRLVMVRRNEL